MNCRRARPYFGEFALLRPGPLGVRLAALPVSRAHKRGLDATATGAATSTTAAAFVTLVLLGVVLAVPLAVPPTVVLAVSLVDGASAADGMCSLLPPAPYKAKSR